MLLNVKDEPCMVSEVKRIECIYAQYLVFFNTSQTKKLFKIIFGSEFTILDDIKL